MSWIELYEEERYSSTPFPERRLRLRLWGLRVTLWRWSV